MVIRKASDCEGHLSVCYVMPYHAHEFQYFFLCYAYRFHVLFNLAVKGAFDYCCRWKGRWEGNFGIALVFLRNFFIFRNADGGENENTACKFSALFWADRAMHTAVSHFQPRYIIAQIPSPTSSSSLLPNSNRKCFQPVLSFCNQDVQEWEAAALENHRRRSCSKLKTMATVVKEISRDAAVVLSELDRVFTLKEVHESSTESFSWWIISFYFTPK